MSQEYRVVPAALLESALKTLAGVAPGRFAVEAELRAIVDAPVPPDGGEVEVQSFWAEEARNIRCVRESDFDSHVTRLQAENAALQQRLNIADQRVDDATDLLQRAQQLIPELQYNWHANTKALLDSMNSKQ